MPRAGLVLLITRDGEVVFEQQVQGSTPARPFPIASGTKSFWGTLAVCAIEDGLFTIDERAAATLTEWRGDPRKSRVAVRHLLRFTSGPESPRRLWAARGDKAAFAFAQPAVADPGTRWTHGDVRSHAFGEFLCRRLAQKRPRGRAEHPFGNLERKTLMPIGLGLVRWKLEDNGEPAAGDGAVLAAREWAKLGELVRLQGE